MATSVTSLGQFRLLVATIVHPSSTTLMPFPQQSLTSANLGIAFATIGIPITPFLAAIRGQEGAGPKTRGFTNGKLDQEYDYIEPAAAKAAAYHADNPILGPFYSWIVKREQADKISNIMRSQDE